MPNTPQTHIITTKYGKLLVIFTAGNAARVLTAAAHHGDPDLPFVVNGVRCTVDAHMHPPGACKAGCPEGDHAGGSWAHGYIRSPEHASSRDAGEVDGYTRWPTVQRYGSLGAASTDKARALAKEAVTTAVNTLAARLPSWRIDADRYRLCMALESARGRVETARSALLVAQSEWQALEDELDALESSNSAAA